MLDGSDPKAKYPVPDVVKSRLANDFVYHKPAEGQPERCEYIWAKAGELAIELWQMCPASRELSTALTKLDEVVFWANAAIARGE